MFVQACDGALADVEGTVEIGKSAGAGTGAAENVIHLPIDLACVKDMEFNWLGEYNLTHGDRIRYRVSAETGNGLVVGLAALEDDPLNRTYYTMSSLPQDGVLEVSADFVFSDPVPPGQYRLFIRAANGGDSTNVKGFAEITKQGPGLETVTIKDKTYYMIMTKEQLMALAAG